MSNSILFGVTEYISGEWKPSEEICPSSLDYVWAQESWGYASCLQIKL